MQKHRRRHGNRGADDANVEISLRCGREPNQPQAQGTVGCATKALSDSWFTVANLPYRSLSRACCLSEPAQRGGGRRANPDAEKRLSAVKFCASWSVNQGHLSRPRRKMSRKRLSRIDLQFITRAVRNLEFGVLHPRHRRRQAWFGLRRRVQRRERADRSAGS